MKRFPLTLTCLALLTGFSSGQSQELYSIARPAGSHLAWSSALIPLDDLTGDGVPDLLISGVDHGGGEVGTVHSGADGDLLFHISVPNQALFYGDGFACVADRNADGIRDIVVIGSRSGDSQSFEGEFRIHSGADGSTLHVFRPPTGLNFVAHGEWSVQNLGDMDGDGSDDVLCRTSGTTTGGPTYSLFSSADGHLIYHVVDTPTGNFVEGVARLADHDGDGLDDYALARRQGSSVSYLTVISGASGQPISEFLAPELSVLTGNREPFIGVRENVGAGAHSVAFGGIFTNGMGSLSTLDGQVLWNSSCNLNVQACFGSRMIDVGDFNGDGQSDLLAIETRFGGSGTLQTQVLDGSHGEVLLQEDMEGAFGGYSNSDRIVALPGVDKNGFPAFARVHEQTASVSVRRLVPEIGSIQCPARPNSTGLGALLRARGSASRSAGLLDLSLDQAPPGTIALFIQGDRKDYQIFGEGRLCVGGQGNRLGFGLVDGSGHLGLSVDLSSHVSTPGEWFAQALFRDSQRTGLNSSNSIALELRP